MHDIGYETFLSDYQRNLSHENHSSEQPFLIHQVNRTTDFLLHLDDHNCERFHKVHDIVKQSTQLSKIQDFFLTNFGERLQKITNRNITSGKLLTQMCNYFQWAEYSKLNLSVTLNDNDFSFCLAAGDSKLYYNAYGHSELWKLAAYEYLQ